jgi:hypothetical protein
VDEVTSPTGERVQIYWHRDLPPSEADALGEHVLEATSAHVAGRFGHQDDEWLTCYESLMSHVRERLAEEVVRLGGTCAHVLKETIEARHNDTIGEGWLYGRFEYMLFRAPCKP